MPVPLERMGSQDSPEAPERTVRRARDFPDLLDLPERLDPLEHQEPPEQLASQERTAPKDLPEPQEPTERLEHPEQMEKTADPDCPATMPPTVPVLLVPPRWNTTSRPVATGSKHENKPFLFEYVLFFKILRF